MEILILQVFVSLMLVLGSVVLFVFSARQRDFDHADRLALLPIEDSDGPVTPATPATPATQVTDEGNEGTKS